MAKKEDKKPATKTAQCFVCMRPTQIPVDGPKTGMVVCNSCYASTIKEFNDKKKKKP